MARNKARKELIQREIIQSPSLHQIQEENFNRLPAPTDCCRVSFLNFDMLGPGRDVTIKIRPERSANGWIRKVAAEVFKRVGFNSEEIVGYDRLFPSFAASG